MRTPNYMGRTVSDDCDRARKHILVERRKLGFLPSWRESTSRLGPAVPGLEVRGDGTGLMGGTGYAIEGGRAVFREPFFLRQAYLNEGGHDDVDGLYVASVSLPRYGQVGRSSAPMLLDEAITWLILEYTNHREYVLPADDPEPPPVPEGPRKSAWEHLLEGEDDPSG